MRGTYGLSQEVRDQAVAALKEIYDGIKEEYEKLGDLALRPEIIFFRGFGGRRYNENNLVEIGQAEEGSGWRNKKTVDRFRLKVSSPRYGDKPRYYAQGKKTGTANTAKIVELLLSILYDDEGNYSRWAMSHQKHSQIAHAFDGHSVLNAGSPTMAYSTEKELSAEATLLGDEKIVRLRAAVLLEDLDAALEVLQPYLLEKSR